MGATPSNDLEEDEDEQDDDDEVAGDDGNSTETGGNTTTSLFDFNVTDSPAPTVSTLPPTMKPSKPPPFVQIKKAVQLVILEGCAPPPGSDICFNDDGVCLSANATELVVTPTEAPTLSPTKPVPPPPTPAPKEDKKKSG